MPATSFYIAVYDYVEEGGELLTLTYEYKAAPTKEQIQKIEYILMVCRKIWNFALRKRKDWLNSRKCAVNACSLTSEYVISSYELYPNYIKQAKALTVAFIAGSRTKNC